MPKTDKNHEIDKKGSLILESALQQFCVLNKMQDDFGIDYHADILQCRKITGSAFYIQLKSHESIDFHRNSFISESIDWDHLLDWNRRDLPLFLCSTDVSTEKIYWVYIQDYLYKNPRQNNSFSHSVRIPVQNELKEYFSVFVNAVLHAVTDLKSFASIEHRKQSEFSAHYPYFNFTFNYVNGVEQIHISSNSKLENRFLFDERNRRIRIDHIPSTPFHMEFSLSSDQLLQQFVSGEQVECSDIDISCPELFSQVNKFVAKLHNLKHKSDAYFIINDAKASEAFRLDGFTGTYHNFQNHYGFDFKHTSNIISFHMFDNRTTCSFLYDYWDDFQIIDLPYLDLIDAFFNMRENEYTCSLCIRINDQYVPVGFGAPPVQFNVIRQRIKLLKMARQVFRKLGISLKVKDIYTVLNSTRKIDDYLPIICSIYKKRWTKKINNFIDMAKYFTTARTIEALQDYSFRTSITEDYRFFQWKLRITIDLRFTQMEQTPDKKGLYFSPTKLSEIIFEIMDVKIIDSISHEERDTAK